MNILHLSDHESNLHTQNAHWLAVVWPFEVVDPVNKGKLIPGGVGYTDVTDIETGPAAMRVDGVYILDDQILNWSVSGSKDSPTGSFSCNLPYGTVRWMQNITPGDWICFWAFEDRQTYEQVLASIRAAVSGIILDSKTRTSPNTAKVNPMGFENGLKFAGQIRSVRENISRNPDGYIDGIYSVSATSFSEMASTVYYDPMLSQDYPSFTQFLGDFGLKAAELFSFNKDNQGFANITEILPKLSKIILGTNPNTIDSKQSDPLKASPNSKFKIPKGVADLFSYGKRDIPTTISDLHRYYTGRQTFQTDQKQPWKSMVPEADRLQNDNVYLSINPFADKMLLNPFDLRGNQSLWGILKGYLNEPINEMYTGLRPDATGTLYPSVIFRTNPLSSYDFSLNAQQDGFKITPMSAYPSWMITNDRITSCSVGRSDASRLNFLQISCPDRFSSKNEQQTQQSMRVFAPPAVVSTDIVRNGLRMYVQRVPSQAFDRTVTPNENLARVYTAIMSDILLDSHLRFSGSVMMEGVQRPICHGDNAIVNGVLYHIESVTHMGSIGPGGEKSFNTELQLSHGMPLAAERVSGVQRQDSVTAPASPQNDGKRIQTITFRDHVDYNALAEDRNNRTDLDDHYAILEGVVKIGPV